REGEEHRDGDADQERRVDETREQEHAAGEHRGQLGLTGSRLEELRAHDADAEAGADGAETDDDTEPKRGESLDGCDRFHLVLLVGCVSNSGLPFSLAQWCAWAIEMYTTVSTMKMNACRVMIRMWKIVQAAPITTWP